MGGNGCAFFFCFVGLRSGGHGFCICLFEFCPKANDRDNGFIESLEGPPGPNVRCIHSFCCRRTLWDCHTIRWFTAFDRAYV